MSATPTACILHPDRYHMQNGIIVLYTLACFGMVLLSAPLTHRQCFLQECLRKKHFR